MICFTTIRREVAVLPGLPGPDFEMKLLPLSEIEAAAPPASPANPQAGFQRTDVNSGTPPPASAALATKDSNELNQRATDGLLINGSANNAASSPFSLAPAFGNNRRGRGSLYTGSLGLIFDNSAIPCPHGGPAPGSNQPSGPVAAHFLPAAEFQRRHALQLPGRPRHAANSKRPSIALQQRTRHEESGFRHFQLSGKLDRNPEPFRFYRQNRHPRNQYRRQLAAPLQPAALHQHRLSVQPPGYNDNALLGQP